MRGFESRDAAIEGTYTHFIKIVKKKKKEPLLFPLLPRPLLKRKTRLPLEFHSERSQIEEKYNKETESRTFIVANAVFINIINKFGLNFILFHII